MIIRRGSSIGRLVRKTLDKKRGYSSDKYKTELDKDKNDKEILTVFHYEKMFFKYNLANKKIISFDQVTTFSITNLNVILEILQLPGEFVSTFGRIGYSLVYVIRNKRLGDKRLEDKRLGGKRSKGGDKGDKSKGDDKGDKGGEMYGKDMSRIRVDLDERLRLYNSRKSKARYRKIKEKMDTEIIALDRIYGHKVEMEKIGDKWHITSDIELGETFPITFKQAFSAASNLKSEIYKVKYFDYLLKKIDSGLDKWKLAIKNNCKYEFSVMSNGDGSWTLDSEGDIFFDKRIITKDQLIGFIRYIFGIEIELQYVTRHGHIPDIVRNTPINVVLTDDCIKENKFNSQMLAIIDTIGRDIRIINANANSGENGNSFSAISSYGKECVLFEYDVDSLVRHGWMYYLLQRFDKKLIEERTPERILVMKELLDKLKLDNKYPIVLEEDKKRLIIHNSDGEFYLSLADGSLRKIIEKNDEYENGKKNEKYDYVHICVGLRHEKHGSYYKPFIIHNKIKYDIDFVMSEVLSKMMMLINEKYPDKLTEGQIKFKGRLR